MHHKLSDIALGWANYIQGSDSTKELMKQRLAICDTCPNKIQVTGIGNIIFSAFNDKNNLFKCNACSCPLGTLASVLSSLCRLNKWP